MTMIYDVPLDKLVELDNLINNSNYTVDDWLAAYNNDKKLLHDDLVGLISLDIHDKGFDGEASPDDYYAMYWFVKGIKAADDAWESLMNIQPQTLIKQLPIPHAPKHPKQVTKYIDSDIPLFNKLKHLRKINDPSLSGTASLEVLYEFNRQRLHEKFNRDLHKKDDSLMDSIKKQHRYLNEF
ncbi:hypothetical protein M9Y10_003571 [Tritrichomonas musculus]|uniref:Uncharacterized protein n=1 Tax=Tritrichomonas musculus TaxID=1915356 RepID=A0ABR2JQJ0_9EUKA